MVLLYNRPIPPVNQIHNIHGNGQSSLKNVMMNITMVTWNNNAHCYIGAGVSRAECSARVVGEVVVRSIVDVQKPLI